MSGLAHDVYTGSAAFGRFESVMSAVVITVIGLIFIVVSISLINKKPDPKAPPPKTSPRKTGFILLAITLVVMGMSYANMYVTFKYKSAAAVEGVSDGLQMLRL